MSAELRAAGVALEYVDLGGGLGISYDGREVPSPADYVGRAGRASAADGAADRRRAGPRDCRPGRRARRPGLDIKPRDASRDFVVIDAGMTELMRPALYGAFHRIEPLAPRDAARRDYEIVGPVCESSDVVGRDRRLPRLEVGDLVAIRDAGAYGSAMASNYNRRPLPAEVLVDDGTWRVIRRRQTLDDMLSLES